MTALDDPFPTNQEPFHDDYEYECDSDFDEEDEKPHSSSEIVRMYEDYKERLESGSIRFHGLQGKTIVIKDAAYNTYVELFITIELVLRDQTEYL